MSYYPKLIHALPFTPVNSPKILGQAEKALDSFKEFYLGHPQLSSQHFLFTSLADGELLRERDYFLQKSLQFHFKNRFACFDDFLASLKGRKAKQIRKERKKVKESQLQIKKLKGAEISRDLALQIYHLYLSTIDKKHSYAYLTEDFFTLGPGHMPDNWLVFAAFENEELIAMSLFIAGSEAIYGRYWGIKSEFESRYPFLHFEMCYYLGMEYCMQNSIPLFEAGAQGEQKLLRGFEPVIIESYHHLKHPQLSKAIQDHIEMQNQAVAERATELRSFLPFKESTYSSCYK